MTSTHELTPMTNVERRRAEAPERAAASTASHADARAIVLVEGMSDQVALETLAIRRGRDLAAEGVRIVPVGGAQAIGRFLAELAPRQSDVQLAGLCDSGEEAMFARALERAGFGSPLTRGRREALGFYVCIDDLEDELIRALGADAVEALLESHGDLPSFHTMQKQPTWRGRPVEAQLRRFMGSRSFRKITYARILVDALDLARVPRPLDGALGSLSLPS